jgi:hypothetical protein
LIFVKGKGPFPPAPSSYQNQVMKTIAQMDFAIKTEELALTLTGIYFLYTHSLGLPLWLWIPLFLSPDISMFGYLAGTRIGAYTYNLFHHRAIAIALAALGLFTHLPVLATIGILLFAHSSFDRMMGYGLKFTDDFKHTHLGLMGKTK